jgi:hypothetical protein
MSRNEFAWGSHALRLLHEFTYALVNDGEPDLSARQLTVLLTIYLKPPPPTVRGLAANLNLTKPVITRGETGPAATHKVAALRTLVFPGPDIKLPPTARAGPPSFEGRYAAASG